MILTDNEKYIIETLRSLPPYAKVEITADPNGKYDSYLVHKSQKVVLSNKINSTERRGANN